MKHYQPVFNSSFTALQPNVLYSINQFSRTGTRVLLILWPYVSAILHSCLDIVYQARIRHCVCLLMKLEGILSLCLMHHTAVSFRSPLPQTLILLAILHVKKIGDEKNIVTIVTVLM
jgi:hypothetical protein